MADLPEQLQAQAAQMEEFDAQVLADQAANAPAGDDPPAPEAPPAPAEPAAPAPVSVEDDPKFKTLKGKYDKEVPALHDQVRVLQEEVQNLKAKPAAEPEPAPQTSALTDKDAETFGPELIEVITRAATHIAEQAIAPLRAQVEALQTEAAKLKGTLTSVAEVQVDDANTKFWRAVEAGEVNVEALNADPRFIDWCKSSPPGTRTTYQAQIVEATDTLDATWMIELVNTYKATQAPAQPEPPPPAGIEDQIQPAKSAQSNPPAPDPDDKKIWTSTEVNTFYREVSQKKYSREEAAEIEAQIDRATAEGRVR